MANNYNPTIVKGDTVTWAMTMTDASGLTYDLTGSTFTMQIRKSYYPGDEIVEYQKGVTAGTAFVAVDGITGGLSIEKTQGLVYVTVGSNYTNQFPDYVPVFYDIQMQYPNNGGIVTILRGTITSLLQVTEN